MNGYSRQFYLLYHPIQCSVSIQASKGPVVKESCCGWCPALQTRNHDVIFTVWGVRSLPQGEYAMCSNGSNHH